MAIYRRLGPPTIVTSSRSQGRDFLHLADEWRPCRCVSRRAGGRYTSREVILNPVDEAGHRGLERLDILTLVFL